jgi:hypothetical protein
MKIGLDLDNTIVRYDAVFFRAAVARGWIEPETSPGKAAIRAEVTRRFGNEAWTELQGEVYGPRMAEAEPYPGVEDFLRRARAAEATVCILSHKTRFAARGARHDLRAAARGWIEARGFFGADLGLSPEAVEFHDSRAEKVAAIGRRGCEVFVDDLPEVFAEPHFPSATRRVLFDPDDAYRHEAAQPRVSTWAEIEEQLLATRSL